jgi:hypothetical protein
MRAGIAGDDASSRRAVRGAVGAAVALFVCCLLAPLLIGLAGLMAIGLEVATILAVIAAVVLTRRHRRTCGATAPPGAAGRPQGGRSR